MDVEQLLTGSRWELLEQIARRPQSTGELAETIRTSPANVSQQLRQLELAGLVERQRSGRRGAHYSWTIKAPFFYIVHLDKNTASKQSYSRDDYERFLAGLLLHKHRLALLALFCGKPEIVSKMTAVGVLDRAQPELFVIAEDVEAVRRQHASIDVQTRDGAARIAVWSHTTQEVLDGLERKEPYFLEACDQITLLFDPQEELAACLERRNPQ